MCMGGGHSHGASPVGGDVLEIEVLADGTIKTYSNKVGQANHANAEAFLAYVARMTGGAVTREKRALGHVAVKQSERVRE